MTRHCRAHWLQFVTCLLPPPPPGSQRKQDRTRMLSWVESVEFTVMDAFLNY